MKSSVSFSRSLVAMAIGAVLAVGVVSQLSAQTTLSDRRAQREAERANKGKRAEAEVRYPDTTREQPQFRASPKIQGKLKKLTALYDEDSNQEAMALADEIIADSKANPYEKAFAAQLAGYAANNEDNAEAKAIAYMAKAVELNALDNNSHFDTMFNLAVVQIQQDKFAEGLKTLDQFFAESKSTRPDQYFVKGQTLYQMERYSEAVPVLREAIKASPTPKDSWNRLLMSALLENGQVAEALVEAETIAARSPDDVTSQVNLASIYMQAEKDAKAIEILERLRSAGKLTQEGHYKTLYTTYANMENKERETIAVINEGLSKGLLKPEYQIYLGLAQAYYYSDQPGLAIESYRKAAPLAPTGETYLNLARLLWQEDRIPEAKEAARQAQAKGVKNPADIKKILALPSK